MSYDDFSVREEKLLLLFSIFSVIGYHFTQKIKCSSLLYTDCNTLSVRKVTLEM